MNFAVHSVVVALSLFGLSNAHGVMSDPKPYGFGTGLSNGPMAKAAFPCKSDEVTFSENSKTTWSGGQTQPLKLVSGATHGGGSCFIAMTYETPGSAGFKDPSNWRNIYTIPGDCPATTPGNLPTVSTTGGYPTGPQCASTGEGGTDCVHSYNIPMADQLKDGNAVFAWVWLSKVTTETYMNCAPITISGAKASGDFSSLPSLSGLSFTGLSGGAVPGGDSKSTPSYGSGGSGGGSGSSPAAPPAASSGTAKSGSGASVPAGQFAQTPATPAAPPPAAPASSGSGSSGEVSNGASGACSPDGSMTCTSTSFSMCSNGAWVAMGSIGGLTCSNGKLNKRYRSFVG
ncbi:hypothetical protein EJ08DRAFT_213042 [Tothia fuscella]|uniref:Carbohydrate-binding module family 19 domain-containing protein n=1 Tax=Tothia fuscella TaxID=1048955 RepID=A0A9P4NRM1_9PEZI|nr:hypothetical protein EJ08DRAFT_213042 [Tothia fuscella]